MKLRQARAVVEFVVEQAAAPVSVFVADEHGELVAAATMDGAAPDTRLNAQRKAYTVARSDASSTGELADKVRDDPAELASFDPLFTFFRGGVSPRRTNLTSSVVSSVTPHSPPAAAPRLPFPRCR